MIFRGFCRIREFRGIDLAHYAEVRWNEHNNQNHQNTFEATSTTILHGLSFQMLQKMLLKRYIASYIALWKPDLNEQKDFERLVLFRNCVT